MTEKAFGIRVLAFIIAGAVFAVFGFISYYWGDLFFAQGPLPGLGILFLLYALLTVISAVFIYFLTRNIQNYGGRRHA